MGCGSSSNQSSPTVSPTSTTTTTPSSTIVSKHALPLQTGTTAQSAALHALFLKHDKQLNNQLSATDLATLYIDMTMSKGSTSITQKDINAIMDFIDTDGSGGISRGEFLEWIESGFGKKASQLKKFGKQGHTESLLVDFLIGVITHVHGWLSSFQNLFRGNEDGITDSKLFGVLQQGMSTTGSFGNNNSVKTPPLKSILTFQNSSDSLIQPQDAIDFIAHMALHSKYRPHTVTQQQKQIYRTLLATIEAGMFEKKNSAKTVSSNPLVVLACSAMFSTYDTSGDDVLDAAELRRMLNAICVDAATGEPPSREESQELLQLLDVDNDGMLSREEFINAVLSMMHKEDNGVQHGKPVLSGKLEISVVNLARQLERRRTMLHRLHKKYAKKNNAEKNNAGTTGNANSGAVLINQDGVFRLLRHCQRKLKVELQHKNDGQDKQNVAALAKVTDVAVEAVMGVYQAATKATSASAATAVGDESTGSTVVPAHELVLAPATFSGPILLSSCMHPAQINKQRGMSKSMNLVLDMYELINSEVGRMVVEGNLKREKKRNDRRAGIQQQQNGGRGAEGGGSSEEDSDDSDSDDDAGFGLSGGGGAARGKVDFGW